MKFTSLFKSKALKGASVAALTLALGAGLVGCGGGAVAATVNGQNIEEQTVTDYIADFRENNDLSTDEAWGQWMVSNGYTPETVRQEVIDYYINQDLYEQAAKEYNVAVEQTDIDARMDETKAQFESEDAFKEALEASGMTEDEYIEDVVKPSLLQSKLSEAIANESTDGEGQSGDDAMLATAQQYADQFNGAKKSSHILFSLENEAQAKDVLNQINSGSISFEDAAKQYSTDTASAENGGDAGWDKLTTFVDEYQNALNGLEKDQIVAAPVKSEYGYHIIKVTDVWNTPEGGITSLDQLPTEFQEYLQYMQQSENSQSFSTWFTEYRENADIKINDMPEGLPYAIDLTPYQEQATDNELDANAAAGTEETVEGETAAAEGDQAAADQAQQQEQTTEDPAAQEQQANQDAAANGEANAGQQQGDAAADQAQQQ